MGIAIAGLVSDARVLRYALKERACFTGLDWLYHRMIYVALVTDISRLRALFTIAIS